MSEVLEIKKQDALKAYDNASKREKALLEDLFGEKTFIKDVTERIKSVTDAINELGENDPDVIEYRKFQKADVPERILAQVQAELFIKALNEGWEPDWDNSNEYKYFPWFKMGSSGFRYGDFGRWDTLSNVGSRLCFKSSELAKYAGTQFTDVYEKFMLIK